MRIDPKRDRFGDGAYKMLFPLILVLPISISLYEIASIAVILLALVSVLSGRRFGRVSDTFAVLAGLYFAANIVSLLNTAFPDESLRGLLKVFRHVLLCLAAVHVVNTEERFRALFRWFLIVAVVIGLDAVLQGYLGKDLFRGRGMSSYKEGAGRLTGPFSHANSFGSYLCLTIPVFWALLGRKEVAKTWLGHAVIFGGFLLLLGCLAGTYSRGAWLAVGVILPLYALYSRSKLHLVLMAIVALGLVLFVSPEIKGRAMKTFDWNNPTTQERASLWKRAGRMIAAKPVFGHGLNTYTRNVPSFKLPTDHPNIEGRYVHNSYLQMGAEIGLAGLFLFLTLVVYFHFGSLGAFLRAGAGYLPLAGTAIVFGVLGLLFHSFAETTLHSVQLVNQFWLMTGIAWAGRRIVRA